MVKSLKKIVVPELRRKGFRGGMPHFRRQHEELLDILSFQFSSFGNKFAIELAQCPIYGYTTPVRHIGPDEVVAFAVQSCRWRLSDTPMIDYWFDYQSGDFDSCSICVINLLPIAERWWRMEKVPFSTYGDFPA